ncbi:o-succinylbenzoate--CoA ligase, partial [Cronobacter malonaticus]
GASFERQARRFGANDKRADFDTPAAGLRWPEALKNGGIKFPRRDVTQWATHTLRPQT